jgi:hypothetical protein
VAAVDRIGTCDALESGCLTVSGVALSLTLGAGARFGWGSNGTLGTGAGGGGAVARFKICATWMKALVVSDP